MTRFLISDEKKSTYNLALKCFGDKEFMDEFYSSDVEISRVAVEEQDGVIVSMAMSKKVLLDYGNGIVKPSEYIFMVCTDHDYRHKGYMHKVMEFLMNTIETETVFLIPVDPNIYYSIGFVYSWKYRTEDKDKLYADDGLDYCYSKLMNTESFVVPNGII